MGRRHLDYISILLSKHLQEDHAQKQVGDKRKQGLCGFLDLRPRQRRGLGSHAIVVFWLSFADFVGLDNRHICVPRLGMHGGVDGWVSLRGCLSLRSP
jgi:hypothetical protein